MSQQQLLIMITQQFNQQFNHQLEILKEGRNLNTNSVDNIAKNITEFHHNESGKKTNFCFVVQKMDRHFPKPIFAERRTLENTSTNSETGNLETRPLHKLHPTKAANGFHIYRNSRTAKRNLWEKQPLFNTRFNCLKLEKSDEDDYQNT